jgi:hypothetical protein
MLSPSAARMRYVTSSIGVITRRVSTKRVTGSCRVDHWTPRRLLRNNVSSAHQVMWKSSVAWEPEEEEVVSGSFKGHAAAAEVRAAQGSSHEEAWMINLGRNGDNEWLTGTRTEDWFTGLSPRRCPGELSSVSIFVCVAGLQLSF